MKTMIDKKKVRARRNIAGRYSNDDGLGSNTSGSGMFDWGGLINKGLSTIETTLTGIFGKSDKYMYQAQKEINEQQKQTTYIILGILAIVLALAAFLILRKK